MTDAAAELEAPAPAIAELASNMPAALGADALAVPGLREEHGREEPALAVPGLAWQRQLEAVAGADVEADRRGVAGPLEICQPQLVVLRGGVPVFGACLMMWSLVVLVAEALTWGALSAALEQVWLSPSESVACGSGQWTSKSISLYAGS